MFRVQRDTQKGEWREVENFKISAAGGQYRPSNFQYKMTIIGDTVIRPTDYRNGNHFLSLASYEDISKGECKPYFLIGMYTKLFYNHFLFNDNRYRSDTDPKTEFTLCLFEFILFLKQMLWATLSILEE